LVQTGPVTSGNPFLPPAEDRDPNRRLRGRLAGAVTIVTAGSASDKTGLTVSSLFVLEGEPGEIHMVVGPLTDLWDVVARTGKCVVHLARAEHAGLSDVFAGLRPSPGGQFAGTTVSISDWGPVLTDLPDRAYCRLIDAQERGWSGLVALAVDRVEVSDLGDPLIHFRGSYRRLR
jgi:flavin reductase (DIM6/NTAB) family NADH-FMN oxidoreductase RutF